MLGCLLKVLGALVEALQAVEDMADSEAFDSVGESNMFLETDETVRERIDKDQVCVWNVPWRS